MLRILRGIVVRAAMGILAVAAVLAALAVERTAGITLTDDGALLKSGLMRAALRLFGKLGIQGPRQLAVTAYCVRTFFDAYLKDAGERPLKIASPQYPEVEVVE